MTSPSKRVRDKYDESKFDPTDSNAASGAVEDALCLAVTMLRWRAESWPKDSSLNDGGWADQCVRIISKYGFKEQIPELYRSVGAQDLEKNEGDNI